MRVVWTPRANRSLEYILTCATDFYGKDQLRRLMADIKRTEPLLCENPRLGSAEPLVANRDVEYRSVVLIRPFKIVYTMDVDSVYIMDIWDTRQCPDVLTDRL